MSYFGVQPQKPIPPFTRVMVFIDGGYLREGVKKMIGHDKINFGYMVKFFRYKFHLLPEESEVTRIYYYDAIVDASVDLQRHKQQREYFHKVGLYPRFEVKLGRLIKEGNGKYRQKGVDILISVDMLAKAFQNFYDLALFIGGDDDFVDLINAVKNLTNKKVFGFAFQHNVSNRLLESLDNSIILTKKDCENVADTKTEKE